MNKQFLIALTAAALLTACGTTESKLGMGSSLEDLPQAAQTSIKQQIGDAEILDIDTERRTGRETYEVTYQGSDGMKQKLHVSSDGTVLSQRQAGARGIMHEAAGAFRGEKSEQQSEKSYEQRGEFQQQGSTQGEYEASATSTQGTSASSPAVSATYQSDSSQKEFSAGAQSRSSLDTQSKDYRAEAQTSETDASIEAEASAADASVELDADANVAPKDRIEAQREVRGGAEGLLQKGSLEVQESAGAEISAESSSSSAELEVNGESAGAETKTTRKDREGKDSGKMHVKFTELPEAVQMTLREHGGEASISEIDKKTRDGQTVYEIEFKDADAHGHKEICVMEDGTIKEKDKK